MQMTMQAKCRWQATFVILLCQFQSVVILFCQFCSCNFALSIPLCHNSVLCQFCSVISYAIWWLLHAQWLHSSVTMWLVHGGSYWNHIHIQPAVISEWNTQFVLPAAICAHCIKYSTCTCAELWPTSKEHCLLALTAFAFLVQGHWFSTDVVSGGFAELCRNTMVYFLYAIVKLIKRKSSTLSVWT